MKFETVKSRLFMNKDRSSIGYCDNRVSIQMNRPKETTAIAMRKMTWMEVQPRFPPRVKEMRSGMRHAEKEIAPNRSNDWLTFVEPGFIHLRDKRIIKAPNGTFTEKTDRHPRL